MNEPGTERADPAQLPSQMRGVLEWCDVDKLLLGAFLVLPFVLWYTAVAGYLLAHPTAAPYIDRSYLGFVWRVNVALIAGWLAIVLAGLALRSRRPDSALLVYVTGQFMALQAGFASYVAGHHTTPLMAIPVLTGAAYALLLFDKREALTAIATFLLVVAGTTAAEQAGLIPYAPLLAQAPFTNGRLAGSWLIGAGAINFVGLLAMLGLIYVLIEREREREQTLTATSQQLARANEVIGRYVASQLAEQIRGGNFDALDRHERRKLTLFFSDIRDFAAIADLIEPEDLSALLNDYLSEMTAIGERHGATIDKFVGDAIMIFFGAPVATTDRDHALRAVRMALEMQDRMVDLRVQWEEQGFEHPFHIRIGVNTGHASIGNFGSRSRMDYTAIGRQVNLAARLQAQCEPDRVLLTHSTWVLVREDVACVSKGEIHVKGFREPVKVYEVVAAPCADRAGLIAPADREQA